MKEIDISDLAGIWFHDVTVNRIDIDYAKKEVMFDCIIPVGFWNSPNRYDITEGEVKGTLVITGLIYLVMEPPDKNSKYENTGVIEIIGEGAVTQDKFEAQLSRMSQNLPEDAFLHFFMFANGTRLFSSLPLGRVFKPCNSIQRFTTL